MTQITPSSDGLQRVVTRLFRQRSRVSEMWAEIAELVVSADDEAYGLRRSGEPVPTVVGGGVSDPTAAAATKRQERLRATLAWLWQEAEAQLAVEQQRAAELRGAIRVLSPSAHRRDASSPAGAPLIEDPHELREHLAAQDRRRQRGER